MEAVKRETERRQNFFSSRETFARLPEPQYGLHPFSENRRLCAWTKDVRRLVEETSVLPSNALMELTRYALHRSAALPACLHSHRSWCLPATPVLCSTPFFGRRLSRCQPHLFLLLLVTGTPAFSPAEAKWVKREEEEAKRGRRRDASDAGGRRLRNRRRPAGLPARCRRCCQLECRSGPPAPTSSARRRFACQTGRRAFLHSQRQRAEMEEEARMGMA